MKLDDDMTSWFVGRRHVWFGEKYGSTRNRDQSCGATCPSVMTCVQELHPSGVAGSGEAIAYHCPHRAVLADPYPVFSPLLEGIGGDDRVARNKL